MAKRSVRGDMMRQAIAREAARLMIEHGHEDYGVAKRKAALRFGVTELAVLPKNAEIEDALAEHQRLFGAEEHASELAGMRAAAVDAMRLLAEFEPRLVGPLLSGTATAHNDTAAATLARRLVAARSRVRMWPLRKVTNSRAILRSAAVSSERVKPSLMTDGTCSMARLRTTT